MCVICKEQKNNFSKDSSRKDGLNTKCKDCDKNISKISYNRNKQKQKDNTKKYYYLNKEKIFKYKKEKYNNDISYKITQILRSRFYFSLKINKTQSAISLLGCSIEQLKQHLEQQFLPEMNWENHGKIWEIDHIKPCSSFDLTQEKQQQECFHYSNLQPLFKTTEIAESFGYKNYIGNRDKNAFFA